MQDTRLNIKTRQDTRPKLELIAEVRRWTYAELIDALADHYIETHDDLRAEWAKRAPAPAKSA